MIKEATRKIVALIYSLLPKWNYAIVYGWPDYEDNSLALEESLSQTTLKRVIYFVTTDENKNFPLGDKTRVVKKDSLLGWWYFLFARYIFFTHRCFLSEFPANVVSVNVWHGMPMKKIGWMLEGSRGISASYTIATSNFWAEIMNQAMTPMIKTLVSGMPRTDRFFACAKTIRTKLAIPQFDAFAKKMIWLPTYRCSVLGEIRADGKNFGNIYGMPGITDELLNTFLQQQNAFLIVKPHPMAPLKEPTFYSNLWIIDDQWLRDHGLSLYSVLGQMDAMITDISSIMVGYLVLNRPVIHAFADMNEYEGNRGFSLNPILDYFVGPVVQTIDELFECISQVVNGEDTHAAQRNNIRQLFHEHTDAHSTNRLLKMVGLQLM